MASGSSWEFISVWGVCVWGGKGSILRGVRKENKEKMLSNTAENSRQFRKEKRGDEIVKNEVLQTAMQRPTIYPI
jgi:hypothetical protein